MCLLSPADSRFMWLRIEVNYGDESDWHKEDLYLFKIRTCLALLFLCSHANELELSSRGLFSCLGSWNICAFLFFNSLWNSLNNLFVLDHLTGLSRCNPIFLVWVSHQRHQLQLWMLCWDLSNIFCEKDGLYAIVAAFWSDLKRLFTERSFFFFFWTYLSFTISRKVSEKLVIFQKENCPSKISGWIVVCTVADWDFLLSALLAPYLILSTYLFIFPFPTTFCYLWWNQSSLEIQC